MDTTPKYILMSEKAIKIQEGWRPQRGDFYLSKYTKSVVVAHPWFDLSTLNDTEKYVWLLRQDQLQDMLSQRVCLFVLIRDFKSFCNDSRIQTLHTSMEQLWLAFVMHEKYEKHWHEDKGEWVT